MQVSEMQLFRLNITKTLTGLSSTGRPISDTDMLKWANSTVQKGKPGVRPIRSFRDPSITTGLFFLDLLDALRPGVVDPALVINISETGAYEDRRQNGEALSGILVLFGSSLFLSSEIGYFYR